MKTVLLKDKTVGTYEGECDKGDIITVNLHDENGSPIVVTGEVEFIIDDDGLGYLDYTLDGAM